MNWKLTQIGTDPIIAFAVDELQYYLRKMNRASRVTRILTDGYNDTFASAMAVVTENNYTFPVFFDVNQEAAVNYQIGAIPLSVFINAEGEVVSSINRMISAEELQAGIDSILTE